MEGVVLADGAYLLEPLRIVQLDHQVVGSNVHRLRIQGGLEILTI
jgi:hypothetical protein